jgi:predicted RNase H-like nuclease (RuvC/YqgF family)
MKWLLPLFALSFFAVSSCSSLPPVVSSPDTAPEVSNQPLSDNERSKYLLTIEQLKAELSSLRLLLTMLKNTARNLTPLLDNFEERLKSLQDSNSKLQADLMQASASSTALTQELANLSKDFEAYRQAVASARLRDSLIIGGAAAAGGVILGVIIRSLFR